MKGFLQKVLPSTWQGLKRLVQDMFAFFRLNRLCWFFSPKNIMIRVIYHKSRSDRNIMRRIGNGHPFREKRNAHWHASKLSHFDYQFDVAFYVRVINSRRRLIKTLVFLTNIPSKISLHRTFLYKFNNLNFKKISSFVIGIP